MPRPQIYQERDGVRQAIACGYLLKGPRRVGFQVGSYDPTRPLVIDPILSYSTYLGGSDNEFGDGIAVDKAGSAYVTGETGSMDFPTAHPLQGTLGGFGDAFVAKFSRDGRTLRYSTYLGGSDFEQGFGIAVDGVGRAYVTGRTDSTDFPTVTPCRGPSAVSTMPSW